MKIKVFGGLRKFVDGHAQLEVAFDDRVTVRDIIIKCHIPEHYVYVVERDGKPIDKNTAIRDEGELKLLPIITGG